MTHPLTPREKAALAIQAHDNDHVPDGYANGLSDEVSDWSAYLADRVLTALASGSGDHAELEVVAWGFWTYHQGPKFQVGVDKELTEFTYKHLGPCMDKPNGVQPLVTSAYAQALFAENAALRAAKWEVKHVDTMNDMVLMGMARDEARARATEAERKLAEAREWIGKLDCECDPAWSSRQCGRCTFLSKEAERG